ncbi:hypothetical protein ABK040_013221 [Willaertia magna]
MQDNNNNSNKQLGRGVRITNNPPKVGIPSSVNNSNLINKKPTLSTSTDNTNDITKEQRELMGKGWQTYNRPQFQGIGDEGKSNIQETISEFRAYEFLLRQEEAKRWIEDMLDQKIFFDNDEEEVTEELTKGYTYQGGSKNQEKAEARNLDFFDQLKDGVSLCQLAETFVEKGKMKKYHKNVSAKKNSPLAFMMATDNINNFQESCDTINFPKIYHFSVPDLWERRNITNVVHCIHALAHFLWKLGKLDPSKRIQDLSNSGIIFSKKRLERIEQEFKKLEQNNVEVKLNFNFRSPEEERQMKPKQIPQKPVSKANTLLERFNKLNIGRPTFDMKNVGDNVNIEGELQVTDPEQCIIRGRGAQTGVVGKVNTFEIVARDQYGNDVNIGGDMFNIKLIRIKEKEDDPDYVIETKAIDLNNGIYKVEYIPELIGKYEVDIRLDGKVKLTHSSIRNIRVIPGEAYGKNCEVVDEYNQMQGPFYEGKKVKFKIYARDIFGNYCSKGGDNFYPEFNFFAEDGTAVQNINNFVEVTDLQNGEYDVEVFFPLPGRFELSMTVNDTPDKIPYLEPFIFEVLQREDPGLAIKYEQFFPLSSVIQFSLTAFDPEIADQIDFDNPEKKDTRWVSIISNHPIEQITDETATQLENNIRAEFNRWLQKARVNVLNKMKNGELNNDIDESEFQDGENFYWSLVEKNVNNDEKCNDYKMAINDKVRFYQDKEFVNYVTITEDPQDWTQYELYLQQQLEEEEKRKQLLLEEEERKRKELERLEEERKKNVPPPLNPNQFSVRPRRQALNFWVIVSKMMYDAVQTTKPFQLDKTQKILGYETNELSFARFIEDDTYLLTQRYHIQSYGDLLLSVAQRCVLEMLSEIKACFPDTKYFVIEYDCNNIGKNSFTRLSQTHKIYSYFCTQLLPSPFDEVDNTTKKKAETLILAYKRHLLRLLQESNTEMTNLLKTKMRMNDKDIDKIQSLATFFKINFNDIYNSFKISLGYILSSKPRKILVQELYFTKNREQPLFEQKGFDLSPRQELSPSYSVQIPINKLFDSYSFTNEGSRTSHDREREGLVNPYKVAYIKNGRVIFEAMRSGSFPAFKIQDKKERQLIAVENAKEMLKALAVNHAKRFTREELESLKKRGEPLKIPFTSISLLTPSFVQNREDRQVMEHQGAIYTVLQNNLMPSVLVDLYDRCPPIEVPILFHEPCLVNFGVNVILKTFKCGVGIQRSVNCRQFGIRQFEKKVQRFMVALGEYKNAIRAPIMAYITNIFSKTRDGNLYAQSLITKLNRVNNVYCSMRDKQSDAIRELTPLEYDLQKKQKELEKRINEKWLPKFDDITSVEFTYLKDIMFLVNDMDSMIDKIYKIDLKWESSYEELIEVEQHFIKSLYTSVTTVRNTLPNLPPIPHWQEYYEFCNLERDMVELYSSLKSLYHSKQHEKFNQGLIESEEVKVGDPYAIPVRIVLLSFIIGEQVHFNCKSGKDRTGALMDECQEFAEIREHLTYYPKPFVKDAKLGEYRQKVRTNISMNGGNLDICKYNIGFRGSKLDKTISSKFYTRKIYDEKDKVIGEIPYFKAFKGFADIDDKTYASKDDDWLRYENQYMKTL